MKKIKVQDKYFTPYIDHARIRTAVERVAREINACYGGPEAPVFVSVLNGSFMFTADLLRRIDLDCEVSFVKLSSYEGDASTGQVKKVIGLNSVIRGRHVVIVEDVVETGTTIQELHRMLLEQGPASLRVATAVLKRNAYRGTVPVDFQAFTLEKNDFIIGYGLDYKGYGRNLEDIYIVTEE